MMMENIQTDPRAQATSLEAAEQCAKSGQLSDEIRRTMRAQFDAVDELVDHLDELAALVGRLSEVEEMDNPDRMALRAVAFCLDKVREDGCRISNGLWPLIGVTSSR